MARFFIDTSTQFLRIESPLVSGYPFAMGCWFYATGPGFYDLLWIGDKDVYNQYHVVEVKENYQWIEAFSHDGTIGRATTSAGWIINTWHHAIGIFVSATDRRAFLDGGNKGTDATSVSPSGLDRTQIGQKGDSTPNGEMDGRIAEAAWWDLSVYPGATDSDKADYFETNVVPGLAARFSPLFFPLGLTAYYPLGGVYDADDGDHDIVGGYNMTPQNSPTTADHVPGMIYPSGALVIPSAAEITYPGASVESVGAQFWQSGRLIGVR